MVMLFLAPGFEEIEAIAPIDILRRAEVEVCTVGVGGKTVAGAHGLVVECDTVETHAVSAGMEMLVLPGGMPGTLNLEKSAVVQAFIDHAVLNDLWLGAICAAPSILGRKGLLEGRTVTCYPGYDTQLGGARYTGEAVERDGKLITARGAGVAIPFALELVACLRGRECADALAQAIRC